MTSAQSSSVGTFAFIWVVGGALFALLFWNYYPGMLNADGIDMLCQALHNQFHDWHSPVMSLIWRDLDKVVPGPPLMLALIQGGYIFGACLLVVQLSSNQFLRLGYVTLLVFWPPLLNELGMVTKDSMGMWIMLLFIASLYGLIIEPSRSMIRLAAVVVFALLGIAIRIDMAAYFVAGLALSYKLVIDRSYGGALGKRHGISQKLQLAIASAAAAATIVGCVGLVSVFNNKIMQATPRLAIQATLVHDIAGISVSARQNLMPHYVVSAGVDLVLLRERYTPRYVDPLLFGATPNVPIAASPAQFKELWTAWRSAIIAHPIRYLRHRLATFVHLLDIAQPHPGELYQGHTDPNWDTYCSDKREKNLDDPQAIGLSVYRDDVMPVLLKTLVFRGYAYDVIGLIALLWTLGRVCKTGSDPVNGVDQLIIAIAAASALHQIALFFFSPAAHFRYLIPTVLSCFVIVLLLLSRRHNSKNAAPTRPAASPSAF